MPGPPQPIPPVPIYRRIDTYMLMVPKSVFLPGDKLDMYVIGPGYKVNTARAVYGADTYGNSRVTIDVSRLEIKRLALMAFQIGIDLTEPGDDAEIGVLSVAGVQAGKATSHSVHPARKFEKRLAAYMVAFANPMDPDSIYIEWDNPLLERQVNVMVIMLETAIR